MRLRDRPTDQPIDVIAINAISVKEKTGPDSVVAFVAIQARFWIV